MKEISKRQAMKIAMQHLGFTNPDRSLKMSLSAHEGNTRDSREIGLRVLGSPSDHCWVVQATGTGDSGFQAHIMVWVDQRTGQVLQLTPWFKGSHKE